MISVQNKSLRTAAGIFIACAIVYVLVLGGRGHWNAVNQPVGSHYVHLANSWLHGQLNNVGNHRLGLDDEAYFNGKWFVSFPPFPAVVLLPFVAIFGLATRAALIWAMLAAFVPACLWLLLERVRVEKLSSRTQRENLALTALFAFGTVFFFSSIQGTVWFAAHVTASLLLVAYVYASLRCRAPLWAGFALGLSFSTRPTTLLASVFFLFEAIRQARTEDRFDVKGFIRNCLLFATPIVATGIVAMIINYARFHNPFEFGHTFLQVRWTPRIQRWGLFNYHYLGRNLAVMLAGLPWLSRHAPFVRMSEHGLALWLTTPPLLWLLYPKPTAENRTALIGLYAAMLLVCFQNLLYQNSGWEQFGYRFSLDYTIFMVVLLAMGGQRFGRAFFAAMGVAIAINIFGAITFLRDYRFYESDPAIYFEPD